MPNADSIAYWNEDAGPRWLRHAAAIDRQLEPFLEPLSRAAGVSPGDRILDVGCGAGALSLWLARRVAPGGRVTGVDVSEPLLGLARRRAAESSAEAVEFRRADAQVESFGEAAFDRVLSRFGVMFFDDSVVALENLRGSLLPGGTMTFACWAAPADNPWMGIPREVVARHVDVGEPPDPCAPGPFRFSDPDFLRELMAAAGFDDVGVDRLEDSMRLGGHGTVEETVSFLMEIGPAAALRDAEPETRRAVREELVRALAPYAGPRGVEMGCAAWIVHAHS